MRRGVLPRKAWPDEAKAHPKVKGIFLGGCVARGVGSSFHAKAHAHFAGAHFGWICIRKPDRVNDRLLLLHEIAHILVEDGHSDAFRRRLVEIGGTLDRVPASGPATGGLRSYHKRTRVSDVAAIESQPDENQVHEE